MQELCSLEGKVVVVTGAGSGLGEATARAFAQAGCNIVCVDLNREAIERLSASLTTAGVRDERQGSVNSESRVGTQNRQTTRAIALSCDISNAAAVFATVQQAAEQFSRLDILVNCAAVDYTYSIEELSVEQWDREINVNLRGPFLFAKAAWPYLKREGGHIFNIASTAALRSWANAAPYHASKRGLLGLSQGLSVEGREHNIRVTTIIPGGMKTHFFDRFVEQGIPMPDPKNLQEPATVAATIVFAARVPETSAIQELLITPATESSWP